jgi:EmrB/QacA subfamily drug resistance transporter
LAFVHQLAMPETSLRRESIIIAAVGAGTFAFAFQVSALLTALPAMRSFLRPPLSTEWVMTAYLLCLSTLLLLLGRIGDLFGTKKVYVAGLAIFSGASLLCALAGSPYLFLFGRALQGIGAALAAANSPAILTRNLLSQNQGRALGWQAGMTYLGLALGPSAGGYLISRWEWRAVFLSGLPIGILAVLLAIYAVPRDTNQSAGRSHLPLSTAVLWLACLTPLLFALSRGAQWGWSSPKTGGLLLVSVIALFSFVVAQRRSSTPLLDLALFQRRIFSSALLGELLFYMSLYAIGFLIPILVVRGRALPPAWTGMLLTTQSVLRMCMAPISGSASDRYGTRIVVSLGAAVFAAGVLILACASGYGSMPALAIGMAIVGLGTGTFIPANSSRLLKEAPVHQHGTAAGALATARNLGMMLGVAIAAAVYSSSLPALGGREAELSATRNGLAMVFLIAAATLAVSRIREGRAAGSPGSQDVRDDPAGVITFTVAKKREVF